jgi:hypothetical protein
MVRLIASATPAVTRNGLRGRIARCGILGGRGEWLRRGNCDGGSISLSKLDEKRNWETDGKSSSSSPSSTSPPGAVESNGRKGSVDAECELGSRCSNISLSLEALTQGRGDYEIVEADD